MAHQSPNGGFGNAHPVSYDPIPPEPKKKEDDFEEDISIEEVLSTM